MSFARRLRRIFKPPMIMPDILVEDHVAPYAVVVGVPAREMRFRFEADMRARLIAGAWWQVGDAALALVAGTHDIEAALTQIDAAKPAPLAPHHRPLRMPA